MVTPMRRRVTSVMAVLSAVVVALSLRASQQGHTAPVAASPAGVVGTAPRSGTPSAPPSTKASRTPRASKSAKASQAPRTSRAPRTHAPHHSAAPSPSPTSITVNGAVTDTMYGPVQVQITVRGTRIVSAHAIVYPQGTGTDQQINSQAIPQLDQETLQVQSARIDSISGATYTSGGYQTSLQSALDAAHRTAP